MHSLSHHLLNVHFVPGAILDTENPAETRTVSSCPHTRLVVCISMVASRCIPPGVTSPTLSPYSVPSMENRMADSMAEWLMAGSLGPNSLDLHLSSAVYWL